MIKTLEMGEIVKIEDREFIITYVKGSNGRDSFNTTILKLLKNTIQNDQRKTKTYLKKFKSIKLTNLKGGLKE